MDVLEIRVPAYLAQRVLERLLEETEQAPPSSSALWWLVPSRQEAVTQIAGELQRVMELRVESTKWDAVHRERVRS